MAVIQYTALVNQIRGKLNGSVMNKARTINTVQKKQQQPKGQRGYQSEIRQDFSYAQRLWKELTPTQQTSWQTAANFNPARDRFGNQVILSGYNQFIKARVFSSYAFTALSFNAYPGAAPTKVFEISSILYPTFSLSPSGGVEFSALINDYTLGEETGYGFIFDISLPISRGVTSYHGRWCNVTGSPANTGIVTNLAQDMGTYYPMPAAGQRVLWRARIVYIQTGSVVAEQQGTFDDWVSTPTIESFTVEPTSGAAPYVLSVSFSNKEFINDTDFSFKIYTGQSVGSCPTPLQIAAENVFIANQLLLNGYHVFSTTLDNGECFGCKAQIVRLSDDTVLQESVVYISNL